MTCSAIPLSSGALCRPHACHSLPVSAVTYVNCYFVWPAWLACWESARCRLCSKHGSRAMQCCDLGSTPQWKLGTQACTGEGGARCAVRCPAGPPRAARARAPSARSGLSARAVHAASDACSSACAVSVSTCARQRPLCRHAWRRLTRAAAAWLTSLLAVRFACACREAGRRDPRSLTDKWHTSLQDPPARRAAEPNRPASRGAAAAGHAPP